jgi:hypothetical protein
MIALSSLTLFALSTPLSVMPIGKLTVALIVLL